MADPFVAEIRIFPYNFAPTGWAFCNGQLLSISQNTALFSLLGTTYGGNGTTNFALPDLQGRMPMFWGQGPGLSLHDLGEVSGQSAVTLLQSEIPSHSHTLNADSVSAAAPLAPGASIGKSPALPFRAGATDTTMNAFAAQPAGSSLPHNNMPPYLAFNFCIALQGVFPPRT